MSKYVIIDISPIIIISDQIWRAVIYFSVSAKKAKIILYN